MCKKCANKKEGSPYGLKWYFVRHILYGLLNTIVLIFFCVLIKIRRSNGVQMLGA